MNRGVAESGVRRLIALVATLGALAMLAMAGGASFGGL